jgi:histidinol-phosphate aminotransferase
MSLAFTSYEGHAPGDGDDVLNLAWTIDEQEWLGADLRALVATELRSEADEGHPWLGSYLVRDPWGEAALRPAVAAYFGVPATNICVTCAAGVNHLLQAAALCCAGGEAAVIGDVYPDFPHWVMSFGGRCVPAARRAAVLLLERPSLTGTGLEIAELAAVCRDAEQKGGLVVVDESYGNYLPADASAARMTAITPNLIVLRGLSKGFWLGGARLGYAISGPAAAARLRSALAPMAASSLSLRLARAVLGMGDTAAKLRARVAVAQSQMLAALHDAKFPARLHPCAAVPYVFTDFGDDTSIAWLRERGIVAKRQPFWSSAHADVRHRVRLSVPLRPERLDRFITQLQEKK